MVHNNVAHASAPGTRFASAIVACSSNLKLLAIVLLLGIAQQVSAGACDYAPSKLLKGGAAAGGVTAGTGIGLKALGFYTLEHAGSGAIMLGSTAPGASAAGTVGIIGGSGGFLGSAAAFLMNPVTIAAGFTLGVGALVYEGASRWASKDTRR